MVQSVLDHFSAQLQGSRKLFFVRDFGTASAATGAEAQFGVSLITVVGTKRETRTHQARALAVEVNFHQAGLRQPADGGRHGSTSIERKAPVGWKFGLQSHARSPQLTLLNGGL